MTQPINYSEEAHERGFYVDPMDPDEKPLAGITTAIGLAIGTPFLTNWKLRLAAERAADFADDIYRMERDAAVEWVKSAADDARDRSGERGTIVHRVLELAGNGEQPDELMDADVLPYVEAGLAFIADHQVKFIWTEFTAFGENYAGTGDFLAEINGEILVGDYKTGTKVHDEVGMQLAALRHASHVYTDEGNYNTGETQGYPQRAPMRKTDGGIVVHLKGNGKYIVRRVQCGKPEFDAFLGAVEVARFRKQKGTLGDRLVLPETPVLSETDNSVVQLDNAQPLTASVEGPVGTDPAVDPPDAVAPLSQHARDAVAAGTAPVAIIDPALLVQGVFPGTTVEDDPGGEALYQWMRDRVVAVKAQPDGKKGLRHLSTNWPAEVPKIKDADSYTHTQADLLHEVMVVAEKLVGAPFPDVRPGTEPVPIERPVETVPADSARVKKLRVEYIALPQHLSRVLDESMGELIDTMLSGQSTKEQVAKAARAIHAATRKAKAAAKAAA